MKHVTCVFCGGTIEKWDARFATEGGWAHGDCYYITHEPKLCLSLREVLTSGQDSVLARELVVKHMPFIARCDVISEFNAELQRRHQLRMREIEWWG